MVLMSHFHKEASALRRAYPVRTRTHHSSYPVQVKSFTVNLITLLPMSVLSLWFAAGRLLPPFVLERIIRPAALSEHLPYFVIRRS